MKIKLTLLKRLSINMKATLPIRQDGKLLKELDLILRVNAKKVVMMKKEKI